MGENSAQLRFGGTIEVTAEHMPNITEPCRAPSMLVSSILALKPSAGTACHMQYHHSSDGVAVAQEGCAGSH